MQKSPRCHERGLFFAVLRLRLDLRAGSPGA